ncbi:hypothetical protein DVH26_01455 [Paenibacillus sp. H1-7]|uniref:hypothetical protein n=1 Tax=Paenibacillus sp. H1-7 TaxID=2282849 RepID=UPI001EF8CEDF|nr:hypothetical protein [Paenibacillus sp. H1-7]ULL13261.1 hypothetical protein DVH26_01455 [Paenibacillus sp. H1-7]
MNVSLSSAQRVAALLEAEGIHYASGGSGLLYSLGLVSHVRDWDLTTDAPLEAVTAALQDIPYALVPSGDYPFASAYRLSAQDDALPLDIIGGFAIHSEHGICRLPSHSPFIWENIRMGSPEVWAVAYGLMNRIEKSQLLFAYLQEKGASRDIVERMLEEPLPEPLRCQLQEL